MATFEEYTRKKKRQAAAGLSFQDYTVSLLGEDALYRNASNASNRVVIDKVETKKKKEEDSWFKSGAFGDGKGNILTDTALTYWSTIGDAYVGAAKGIVGMVEGVADLGMYGVGAAADLVGADGVAKSVRGAAKKNVTNAIYSPAEKIVDKYSVFGNKADMVTQGVGQALGIIATAGAGAAAGLTSTGATILTTGANFLSSAGSGMSEAYAGGATDKEAAIYGGVKGTIDAGSELLFGGLGKFTNATGISKGIGGFDDMAADALTKKITNQLVKNSAKYAFKSAGEGVEEVIAGALTAKAKQIYSEEEYSTLLEDENLLEQFIVGSLVGGIVSTPSLVQSNASGRDYTSGLTANEQKVVDAEVKNRIEAQETDGKKLSKKEQSKIIEQVQNELKSGSISTDVIESTLVGENETYKNYQSIAEQEKALNEQIKEVQNNTSLTATQKDVLTKAFKSEIEALNKTEAQGKLMSEIDTLTEKDTYLRESYNEKGRRTQKFEADLSKYDDKQKEVIQRAIDSGILNNTNRTHEFVDFLAKVSSDKGVLFDFTNNEKIKEDGLAIEGSTVNGYVKDGTIAVNIQSNKALNTVVGHEVTHTLEGTEQYTELQNMIIEYSKTKGDYQARYDELSKLYEGVENANIENELTADLVGDYLFTDSKFIEELSVTKPNIFKRIYQEIKHLLKLATGSKEARQLEQVKRAFDKAYKTSNATTETDTKYSFNKKTDSKVADRLSSNEWNSVQSAVANHKKLNHIYPKSADGDIIIPINNKLVYTDANFDSVGVSKIIEFESDYENDIDIAREEIYAVEEGESTIEEAYEAIRLFTKIENINEYETEDRANDGKYDRRTSRGKSQSDTKHNNFLQERIRSANEIINSVNNEKREQVSSADDAFFNAQNDTVKYSISEDSNGNTLNPVVQKRFENSKAVDENGALKVLYHGTPSGEFTIFDKSKGSVEGDFGSGFYFTDNEADVSEHYEGGGPDFENKVARRAEQIEAEEDIDYDEAEKRARNELYKGSHKFEVYLNIENPAIVGETILLSQDEYLENYDPDDYDDYDDYIAEVEQLVADDIENLVWEVEKNVDIYSTEGLTDVLYEAYYEGGIGVQELKDKINELYLESSEGELVGNEVARQIIESLGYDGIIDNTVSSKWNMDMEEGTTHYIVFKPNQIKSISNENPTDNPDINLSLSNQNENIAPVGSYNVYGRDIALKTTEPAVVEDIAPVREVAELPTPLTEEMANERDAQQQNIDTLNEAPEEIEAPYYSKDEDIKLEDPFDERDIKDVGKRNVKAYMYENPEVKPYFQQEAQAMLWELQNSVKGEKSFNSQLYYDTNGELGWFGTTRETSDDIAYLLDNFKYTYADIEKGLNAIIEDHGAENNAISKRIEFALNDRLKDGYTDFMSGEDVPANQDYVNLLMDKQINTYSDEAYYEWLQSLANEEAPPVAPLEPSTDEIAPTMEDISSLEGTQRVMDFETGQVVDEDTMSDEEKRIYRKLAKDEKAAYEEYIQKRDALQKELADRNTYISNKAEKLYEELSNLKKGVRASEELGYLLDYGFKWSELKRALQTTKAFPDRVYNDDSSAEALVREAIGREYDERLYEIDDLDREYREHSKQLKADAENEVTNIGKRKTHGEIQRAYVENIKKKYEEAGLDFDKILEKAKDKSTFASVDNTPQRYIEKTLGYKEGQILNDLTINQEALNESKAVKWLNSFTNRKSGELAKLSKKYGIKPNSKEDAAAQMYAEGFYVNDNNEYMAYGDNELAMDFPDVKTQERIKGLAKDPRIREIYDNTLAQINESRARNGYFEIPRRDNYFLHFRAMDDTFSKLGIPFNPNDIRAKDLPTDINGMTADLKPNQPYFASANQRKGLKTSHSLLGGMERYLTSAKNQIYHIDDIMTLRGLRNYVADMYGQAHGLDSLDTMTPEEAEARVKEVYDAHLSTFAKFLNEQANVLAGKTSLIDRGLEGIIGRRGIQTLDTINTQVAKNMVGFNVSSAMTNFVGAVQGFAKANKFDAVKAFAQTTSNKINSIFGKSDGFAENDPTIIRRKGAEKFYRTPVEKVSDVGYTLMSAVDDVTSEFLIRAKYNELTRKGMNSEKAHIEAGKWAMRILGDRSLGQQPQLYNSKMLGLITKFQLEVRNQLDSMFYDTIQEANADTETIKNGTERNAKKAAKIASTMVQLAVFQHLFGKAFESVAGYNPAFDIVSTLIKLLGLDDEEDDEDTVVDNVEQAFLELVGDMPYSSILTGGRIPIESALPIAELVKGVDSYGNEKSRVETIKEAAPYWLNPFGGTNQIKKTVAGLNMFDESLPVAGSYTDSGNLRFPVEDTATNRLQAAIFGQWANENARDYFNNERQPLKEKQIQEFADLDIPIQEYWEYREGLKEQDTIEEKFDYIAGLDLPVSKKNILINNVVDREEKVNLINYDDFSGYEEFDFATKNPEKYEFFKSNNISYADYSASEESKEAYSWAYNNPEKYVVSKAVGDVVQYKQYTSELNKIAADKDGNGKSISGSRKTKVANYINSLNADYGAKIILYKSEYPSDDTYNMEIVEYLNNRSDITYAEMVTILTELGFTVEADGTVRWN